MRHKERDGENMNVISIEITINFEDVLLVEESLSMRRGHQHPNELFFQRERETSINERTSPKYSHDASRDLGQEYRGAEHNTKPIHSVGVVVVVVSERIATYYTWPRVKFDVNFIQFRRS